MLRLFASMTVLSSTSGLPSRDPKGAPVPLGKRDLQAAQIVIVHQQ